MSGQEKKPAEIRYMFGIIGLWTPTLSAATVDHDWLGTVSRTYETVGVHVQNRFIFEEFKPFLANLSVGVNWFDASYFSNGGVGPPRYDSFVAFPVSIGPEIVLPGISPKPISFLAGGAVDMNLIDSKTDVGRRPEWGYHFHFSLLFSVFELGVRYSSLSYIETFGLQFGMRSNLVTIKQ